MSSIAFFDVDRTLIRGYSGFYATRILIEKGILKKRRLLQALFYRTISPLYKGDLRKMYEIATVDMAGSRLQEILEIGRECLKRWILSRIYQEGLEIIQKHKQRGDAVYLITSGPTMVIDALSNFLGADGHFSAGPVVDETGVLTREVRMPIYYREGKVLAAEEAIRKHEVSWEDCYYYADNEDDLVLLQKVGHPVLVNPDRRLRKIGKSRGWPVLRFSRTLTEKSMKDRA